MRNTWNRIACLVLLTSSGFTASALGDVTFEITSPTPNNLGGVYTDPYNALVNGVSIAAFCDDFTDNVTPPQTWDALATNLSQINGSTSTVYYDGPAQLTDYIAAAILATESLPLYQSSNPSDIAEANDISFALWGIFDPTLLSSAYQSTYCGSHPGGEGCLSTADLTAAQNKLSAALAAAQMYSSGAAYETANGVNVEIYSATTNGTTPETDSSRPQEFITVQMAEAPSPGLLAADLAGVGMLAYFFRRRRVV
jgi:hypothetical protein